MHDSHQGFAVRMRVLNRMGQSDNLVRSRSEQRARVCRFRPSGLCELRPPPTVEVLRCEGIT